MESLSFEIIKICLGWSWSTSSCLSLGDRHWWSPELASDSSLSESLVSNTAILCQQLVTEIMNWSIFSLGVLILCGTWCHQIIFISASCGDLWSAIEMQAALTKLPWTNIYLQQSTGSCSCRLLFIYSSLALTSCSLPVFGHLLRAEVKTWVSSNFLKTNCICRKYYFFPVTAMDRYKVIPMDTWRLSLLIWWCQVRQRDWLGHVFTVTILIALQKDIPQTVSSKYGQVTVQILEKIRSLIIDNLLSGHFDSVKHKIATRYFLREPKFIRCHLAGLSWLAQWLGRKPSPPGTVTSQGSQGLTQPVWLGTTVEDPEPSAGWQAKLALWSSWLWPFPVKSWVIPAFSCIKPPSLQREVHIVPWSNLTLATGLQICRGTIKGETDGKAAWECTFCFLRKPG